MKEPTHELYLRVWTRSLTEILRWSEEEVLEFAKEWKEDMLDPENMFYHDTPLRFISGLMIPAALLSTLRGAEAVRLEHRIEVAIAGGMALAYFSEDFNWRDARDRVNAVLQEHGFSLPEG